MERLYHMTATVRKALFQCGGGGNVGGNNNSSNHTSRHQQYKVQKMDPLVRSALLTTVQDELNHPNIVLMDDNDNNNNNDDDDDDTGSVVVDTKSMAILLHEMETELQTAHEQLQLAVQKEQFIGVRAHRYQQLLDQQARAFQLSSMSSSLLSKKKQNNRLVATTNAITNTSTTAAMDTDATIEEDGLIIHADDDEEDPEIGNHHLEEENDHDDNNKNGGPNDENDHDNDDDEEQQQQQGREQQHNQITMIQWETNMTALASIRKVQRDILISCEQLRRNIQQLEQRRHKLVHMQQECQQFISYATTTTTATTTSPNYITTNNTFTTITTMTDDRTVATAALPVSIPTQIHPTDIHTLEEGRTVDHADDDDDALPPPTYYDNTPELEMTVPTTTSVIDH
jgi:hypothetical protein